MKKSIKIIIAILIMFMLMLATKSYAALECKKGNTKDLTPPCPRTFFRKQ